MRQALAHSPHMCTIQYLCAVYRKAHMTEVSPIRKWNNHGSIITIIYWIYAIKSYIRIGRTNETGGSS